MRIRENLTGLLSLPKEITLNLPMVIITGREEVNIENYKGIVEYTETRIRIHTGCGLLAIEGKKLRLKQITAENVIAAGEIESLNYTNL